MAGYDDHMNLPWDSLREQDWASLGCDPGETDFDVLTNHDIFGNQSSAPIEIEGVDGDMNCSALLGFQCSPVAVDSSVDFLWESLGNAKQAQNPSAQTSSSNTNDHQASNQEGWLDFDQDNNGDLKVHDDNKHILPALPSSPLTYAHFSHGIDGMRDESTAKDGFCTGHFCCVAMGDGRVSPHTSDQARFLLENLKRSAGRDEHAVVRLKNEASMDLKILVFPYASPESLALREYIASNVSQIPAPFVLLCGDLSTGMKSSFTDHVSTKVKSYIIKGLAECMSDKRCNITASKLKGNEGPRAAVNLVEPFASTFFKDVIDVDSLPNHQPTDAEASTSHFAPKVSPRAGLPYNMGSSTPRNSSPDESVPSTPRADDEVHVEGKATAHFPVNLFVTAIADGSIESDTPQKIRERLGQIVRKVPKEQNTNVEVCDGGTIDLKMRVFVVNSEDAKAVGEYINSHLKQNPAPFVVLARHLPMAVLYDPTLLDLSDASVADRLRKQAKTRAVKVLREAIANKSLGITMSMMRGHEGALIPADRLHDALGTLTKPVHDGDNPGKYIIFEARNKAGSVPCSPRKRLASEALDKQPLSGGSVQLGMPGSTAGTIGPESRIANDMVYNPVNRPKILSNGNRKASMASASASFLHRDMIVKTFNKRARKEEFPYDGVYDHEFV